MASRVTARTCIVGSNTACPALPLALASYMAASASRSSASDRSCRATPVAMPMLAVTKTDCPGSSKGGSSPLSIRLATAQAGEGVPVPHTAGQPLRDVAEELVSGVVAEAVVDHLEVVQIDEEQADSLPSLPERVLQPVLEQGPVRQAGQRVVERLLGQPLLVQRPLGDVTGVEYQTADGRVVKKVCDGHLEAPGRLPVPEGPHADLPHGGHPW